MIKWKLLKTIAILVIWHSVMEKETGLSLLPSYTYFRVYRNGAILDPHKDRPACEVSASLLAEDGADSEDRHFLDHDSYQQFLRAAVERLHGRAQIVIVGRGGQAILKDREDVVHVRTVAPMDHRIRTVRDRYGVDEGEAKDMIRSSDKRKSAYVKTNYNLDWSDPANYHVILNTGTVPGTVAASLVKSAVNALEGTSA